jgi:V/A-type H+-transporting ATPase subunit E
MSLENITRKILSDAREYAEAAVSEAGIEAGKTAEEYETAAEREYNQIIDAAYEKASEILHRSNAQSMKEKRVNILSAKWEYLDNAFAAAVKSLSKLPDNEQAVFLAGLVRRHQRADAELVFNRNDRERLGPAVVRLINAEAGGFAVTLSERTGDFSGGLILQEGGVEANLTYSVLVAARREQLEDEVSSILFGQDSE